MTTASSRGVLTGSAFLVTAIICVQCSNAVASSAFELVEPASFVGVRLAFGAVVLALVIRPTSVPKGAGDRALIVVLGVVLAFSTLCFYEAFSRMPLGIAVTITFLGPLGVSVAMTARGAELIWPVAAILGVALLAGAAGSDTGTVDATGLLFAALAAAGWAAYILLAARVGSRFRGLGFLALAVSVAALATAPLALASGGTRIFDPRVLALGAACGVLTFALATTFEVESLRRVTPRLFGVLSSMEPVLAALAGLVFLQQPLSPSQLGGICLVVLAGVGASRTFGAKPPFVHSA